jgi:Zn-dependent peptidase ImmA (M78 family)
MNIAYRSKVMSTISKTQAEAKHMAFLDSFVNYLTGNVSYPSHKIILLRDKIIDYINASNEDRETQINQAAKLARQELEIRNDTNDHLMFSVEKSGVFIFEKPIGEEIDAYSLWTKQDRPFIMLGNLKRSAVRRNFDIAHELGHLLLHYRVEFTTLDRKEHKAIEKEANKFAGAFLLPEESLLPDLQTINRVTNPEAYIDLKNKWKTSLQVLGYRAANLGMMDAKRHRNFYAALHRKGYLKKEPLDEIIPIQRPQKVKSIIDLVVREKLIEIRNMIENDWMSDTRFFYQITGIDEDFFNRYMSAKQDYELNNVTDLTQNTRKV